MKQLKPNELIMSIGTGKYIHKFEYGSNYISFA